jgi:hypothetical protein
MYLVAGTIVFFWLALLAAFFMADLASMNLIVLMWEKHADGEQKSTPDAYLQQA